MAPSRTTLTSAVAGIERACARAESPDELFEVLDHEVGRTLPFDGSMWFAVDPATLLATAPARIRGMDGGYCDTFWHHEFHDNDALLFRDLSQGGPSAASLREATHDRPVRSARYREFIAPQGYDDELRAVFRAGGSTWAMASFYRTSAKFAFTPEEVALVGAVSQLIGAACRTLTLDATVWSNAPNAPGLLVFDRQGVLTSANAEAAAWLADLLGPAGQEERDSWIAHLSNPESLDLERPVPVIPLLARARAVAEGHEDGPAKLRVRDRSGRWLVLHASALAGTSATSGGIAVVIEPAKGSEIAPIIIEAYGLSPRERDVVRGLARGASTPELAAELFLSPHTVRDYIKTVFEKVGVSSRGELVAKLFAEHYSDPLHERMVHLD
jgi:DNA-binding CsgD family transcriptional regulator